MFLQCFYGWVGGCWILDFLYESALIRIFDSILFRYTFNNVCLQSRAKYIGNLVGSTENLDLKRRFNVDFWLFSTR